MIQIKNIFEKNGREWGTMKSLNFSKTWLIGSYRYPNK